MRRRANNRKKNRRRGQPLSNLLFLPLRAVKRSHRTDHCVPVNLLGVAFSLSVQNRLSIRVVFTVTPVSRREKINIETGCRKLLYKLLVQVSGLLFRTRVIRQNVSRKFREHSMETPCWGPTAWTPTWRPEINENIWN